MKRRALIGLAAMAASLFAAVPAQAVEVTQHSYSSSFDGAGSTEGEFAGDFADVAVDETTNAVYVASTQPGILIDKFDAAGVATAFSDPSFGGSNTIEVGQPEIGELHISVDNSPTATNGRIYISNSKSGTIWAYNRSGTPVGGNYPLVEATFGPFGVDPVSGDLWVTKFNPRSVRKYTPAGVETDTTIPLVTQFGPSDVEVDQNGNVYVSIEAIGGDTPGILKYSLAGALQFTIPGTLGIAVDNVTGSLFAAGGLYSSQSTAIYQYTPTGAKVDHFEPTPPGVSSIAVNSQTGVVYVGAREDGKRVDIFTPGATITVPEAITAGASDFRATEVTVHGTVDPDGIATTDCHFEWSTDSTYSNSTPCSGGNVVSGSGAQQVDATISGLTQGEEYDYRLVTANGNGSVVGRQDRTFIPSSKPSIPGQWASAVRSDGLQFNAEINPGGAAATYHVEYGTADCATSTCASTAELAAGTGLDDIVLGTVVKGLQAETEYHYRVVATNQSGTTAGNDRTVFTFPEAPEFVDDCDNAHVRQQTSAALLPECRAYELVSAGDTDGYNVESDLVDGQSPFGGYPLAESRALYGVHSGAIPGPWNATNRGVDPYLAIRGSGGWSTEYVGIPADAPSTSPFSSALAEADGELTTFAFGGPEICHPCFADGSTGMPVRHADGGIDQGMGGSIDQPTAVSGGIVSRHFSRSGSHFVFGSTSQFESEGNSNGTDVTIYDRNLDTDVTQVVSTLPNGDTIANGQGVSALAVSDDGSRIVIGRQISTDFSGNHYYHLYMHIGSSPNTVDLTPGTVTGALFDGMTADGSRLFLTTTDHLVSPDDSDSSSDIFEVGVSSAGSVTLRLVSTESDGSPSNDDSCEPAGTPDSWNASSGTGKCNVVAVAGGGGTASGDGTFYFFSPERLDTSDPQKLPAANQANLYVVKPGQAPRFAATIDTSIGKPAPLPPEHPADQEFIEGINRPDAMAVDPSNGDIYVLVPEEGLLLRFDSSGAPKNFTAGPGAGGNSISGFSLEGGSTGVAIDRSGGPSDGNFYVADTYNAVVKVFANDGTELGSLNGSGNASGYFSSPGGVAVDQSNGDLYVGDGFERRIWRYSPSSNQITEADYSGGIAVEFTFSFVPVNLSVASGKVYAGWRFLGGEVRAFQTSDFAATPVETPFTTVTTGAVAFAADPISGNVYVNKRDRIEVFDSSGAFTETIGQGQLQFSSSVAVSNASGSDHHVYASSGEERVVDFGYVVPPYNPVNHPAVVHGVHQAGTHRYGDFQVTADGRFAALGSVQPLSAYDNAGFFELYRYDSSGAGALACVSCNATKARAVGDARLATRGLSLLENGNVFFNSPDPLVARDLDDRQDAYLWNGKSHELISTGSSPFDSSLLGVSADGTDAFFFTKDTLVPQDENGTLVKLYDARVNGGFPFAPDPVPCKASDECHGAGTEAPGPPDIRTIRGTSGNEPPSVKCKRGKVKRNGKCVRKKHKKKRQHKRKSGHGNG